MLPMMVVLPGMYPKTKAVTAGFSEPYNPLKQEELRQFQGELAGVLSLAGEVAAERKAFEKLL